jgi:repressor LexA
MLVENNLRKLRIARGLTQAEMAERIGTTRSQYVKLERGERRLSDVWIERVAQAFQIRPGSLIDSTFDAKAPVIGYIGGGQVIYPVDDHALGAGLDEVSAPPSNDGQMIAVVVRGDSMYPAYNDSDLVFYDDTGREPQALLGKECVIKLSDGSMFVKRLRNGTRPGAYTLESFNAPPMENVEIQWAAPVKWVKKR